MARANTDRLAPVIWCSISLQEEQPAQKLLSLCEQPHILCGYMYIMVRSTQNIHCRLVTSSQIYTTCSTCIQHTLSEPTIVVVGCCVLLENVGRYSIYLYIIFLNVILSFSKIIINLFICAGERWLGLDVVVISLLIC